MKTKSNSDVALLPPLAGSRFDGAPKTRETVEKFRRFIHPESWQTEGWDFAAKNEVMLRKLRAALDDFKGHGMPGFRDRAEAIVIMQMVDEFLSENDHCSAAGGAQQQTDHE